MASSTWVTPGRHTRLILDVPAPAQDRPAWTSRRYGAQISRGRTRVGVTTDVVLQPSGGWTLAPHREDLTRIIDSDWGGAVGSADVNLASHWGAVDTWRKPTELSGNGASGTLLASGVPAFRVQTPAGTSWAQELTADAAAVPKPVLGSADFPMDRVLSSKVTYPANQGFALLISGLPAAARTPDSVLTFYWGGGSPKQQVQRLAEAAADTTPITAAGHYALNLRGNGELHLYEQEGSSWAKRLLVPPPSPPPVHAPSVIGVFPTGRDRMTLQLPGPPPVPSDPLAPRHMLLGGPQERQPGVDYRVTPAVTGYRPATSVTGPGQIRMDVRRLLRLRVTIVQYKLPASGTLVDLPFWIPFPAPAGSILTVTGRTSLPAGTSVSVKLYDAETDTELVQLAGNRFQTLANRQAYYAKFTLTADSDRRQTPVLWGYEVDVSGSIQDRSPTPTTGGNIRGVEITGPDLTPDHETAQVTLHDPLDSLAVLRNRGRIPAHIAVYNDSAALTSILFQGEVARATAVKRGKPGKVYPSANWRWLDLSLVGVWARLAEQVSLHPEFFFEDPAAPLEPVGSPAAGERPPWKITSIIRKLLGDMGFAPDCLDIPDINIRLWADDPGSMQDQVLQPTVSWAEYLMRLAKDYLGMVLLWDANAGTRGMWRLLYNPQAPYNVVAAFVGDSGVAGRLSMHPNSYPAGTAPIRHPTFRTFVRAPECNFVLVCGAGVTLPLDGGPTQLAYSMYNPVSFDLRGATSDATHPDYLGRFVPVVHVDYSLRTPEAVAFTCRRIYDRAAHAEKWAQFQAPLLLITDPLDSLQVRVRPLRVNDAVTVYGSTALVRSCNPTYQHDGVQMMELECLFV